MKGEGDFLGMQRAPDYDALKFDGIVGDGGNFHQLGFDNLRVSHEFPAWHSKGERATTIYNVIGLAKLKGTSVAVTPSRDPMLLLRAPTSQLRGHSIPTLFPVLRRCSS
jgi:hypothetical protein